MIFLLIYVIKDVFFPLLTRSSKGGHNKKKGPRTPSPPPPVPLDLPVMGKKHKGKHKNKEKSEEKQKEGKDRGRDTEKHKEKKEKRRYSVDWPSDDILRSRIKKITISKCGYMLIFFQFYWVVAIKMTVPLVFFVVIHTRKLSSVMFYLWHSSFCTCVVYRDRSDSSHKAKRSVTSEERSGSVSSPSRGTSPSARKKSTSPKVLSHKAPALASPPRRLAHAHHASFITVEFN